ncbi:MAG TPA: patatin-like phospholipase family protein [Symbiobacteriaceae bacterium]|nr:patatin-like phospholipase family protein [Symbiobacteriaceae bacterium]
MQQEEALSLAAPLAGMIRVASVGETVVHQGDSGQTVFMIAEGEVQFVLPGVPPATLDRRGLGSVLGAEQALLGKPTPFAVIAATDVKLLVLDAAKLLKLCREHQEFAEHVLLGSMNGFHAVAAAAQEMYARTNLLEAHIAEKVDSTYGELLGESHAMGALRSELARLSNSEEPVLVVGESGVGKQLAAAHLHLDGRRQTETFLTLDAAQWQADSWRDQVLMAAGGTILLRGIDHLPAEGVAPVGALCTRAASDRPRLVATVSINPGSTPQLPWPWSTVTQVRVPSLRERRSDIPELARAFLRELNAAYGATDEPISSDAMRLLVAYPFVGKNVAELQSVINHAAHLAQGGAIQPEHIQLGAGARRLGRPVVGLALGGGVVRGMAHIGVLQVLQEEMIPIDILAGTSVGSLVGAVFAGGVSLNELERLVPSLSWSKLVGPTWPQVGLLSNVKLGRFVESLIGPKLIEELPVSYAAVAVDRDSGQEVVLRDGPVVEAVRASTAIPGLFQPVTRRGRQLIDGGLVNNVPASVVRSMGADVVLAVDVRDYNYFSPSQKGGLLLSFLRAYDIMINKAAHSELEWADIPIRATCPGANPYGFRMAGALIEAGREQARLALPAIREALDRAEQIIAGKVLRT